MICRKFIRKDSLRNSCLDIHKPCIKVILPKIYHKIWDTSRSYNNWTLTLKTIIISLNRCISNILTNANRISTKTCMFSPSGTKDWRKISLNYFKRLKSRISNNTKATSLSLLWETSLSIKSVNLIHRTSLSVTVEDWPYKIITLLRSCRNWQRLEITSWLCIQTWQQDFALKKWW